MQIEEALAKFSLQHLRHEIDHGRSLGPHGFRFVLTNEKYVDYWPSTGSIRIEGRDRTYSHHSHDLGELIFEVASETPNRIQAQRDTASLTDLELAQQAKSQYPITSHMHPAALHDRSLVHELADRLLRLRRANRDGVLLLTKDMECHDGYQDPSEKGLQWDLEKGEVFPFGVKVDETGRKEMGHHRPQDDHGQGR